MENNVIDMKELQKGAKAGIVLAESDKFDKDVYAKNIMLFGEWAEKINLEPTVGNVYAVCVLAALRTILGDKVFDMPVLDENEEFSVDIMNDVRDKLMSSLGMEDIEDKIHDEETAE